MAYPCYGTYVDVVELCVRPRAYHLTKARINAFTSTSTANSLPHEIAKLIGDALFYDVCVHKRPLWEDMRECAQGKCGLSKHLTARDRSECHERRLNRQKSDRRRRLEAQMYAMTMSQSVEQVMKLFENREEQKEHVELWQMADGRHKADLRGKQNLFVAFAQSVAVWDRFSEHEEGAS